MASKKIHAVDLFCGAGGTSTGLMLAAGMIKANVELTAINHWNVAIETHAKNHPEARHLCETLDNVDPRKLFPGGRIHLLVASPECTHHSIARGGVPCSDQSRASAFHILRWAEALYIDNILIENVPEFMTWGPLGVNGRPLKSMKGKTFISFLKSLESLGYRCSHRIVNTANYGDPTTRMRFFLLARRGKQKIVWPDHTHSETGGRDLFGETVPWVPAKEIIDWSIPGKSIFDRNKPLSPRTMARIEHGLKTFGGVKAKPFLVMLYGMSKSRSIEKPVPTITANSQHIALCEPFILPQQAGAKNQLYVRPTTRGADALIEPFLVKYYGTGPGCQSIGKPLDTVTTRDRFGIVIPDNHTFDIRYRMFQPHELAAAHSFPKGYEFAGTKTDAVKQIGNSVPIKTSTMLCRALLAA